MKVYKRNFISLIWSLILALFALLFINFIVYWFVTEKAPNYTWVFYVVLALSSLYILYSTIFKENIKIEIDSKFFKYYENNKLKGVNKFYDLLEDIKEYTKNKDNIPEAKIIKKGDK